MDTIVTRHKQLICIYTPLLNEVCLCRPSPSFNNACSNKSSISPTMFEDPFSCRVLACKSQKLQTSFLFIAVFVVDSIVLCQHLPVVYSTIPPDIPVAFLLIFAAAALPSFHKITISTFFVFILFVMIICHHRNCA